MGDVAPGRTQSWKGWAQLCRPAGTLIRCALTQDLSPGLTYSVPPGLVLAHAFHPARAGSVLCAESRTNEQSIGSWLVGSESYELKAKS